MNWIWQLSSEPTLPSEEGSFGAVRKYDIHTGVDLYCEVGTKVFAVEDGMVLSIENFTGQYAEPPTPWWNDTKSVLIKGISGVVVYGECSPSVSIGDFVLAGQEIAKITTSVLKKDKGKPTTMLHLELISHESLESCEAWLQEKPKNLLDPTEFLIQAMNNDAK